MTPAPWPGWPDRVESLLDGIRDADRWRTPRVFDAAGPVGTVTNRRGAVPHQVVSFASNDYLGMSIHPAVMDAAIAAIRRWGTGAGASRLVVGSRPIHDELEAALADHKHSERAVVFPTGYAANLGVITALVRAVGTDQTTLVCSDELNHASIIDACRLARAETWIYPHCNVEALRGRLVDAQRAGRPALVVTDAVFSMDGDIAPVDDLVQVCAHTGALLVLDEAHSVFGPDPISSADGPPLVRMTTLSKTLGALGGVVAGPAWLADLLINTARPYIFTTALSPADAAAGLAALRVLQSPEGTALLATLRAHVDRLCPGHPSPIVPIIVGTDRAALDASHALAERGLHVPAIRPPTVAEGTARLRVTLSAAHTATQVDELCRALDELGLTPGREALQ